MPSSTGLPANYCASISTDLGNMWVVRNATSGRQVYECEDVSGTATWVLQGDGGGSTTMLNATNHTDSATATAVRGDLMYVNSAGKWDRFPICLSGRYLRSDGNDPTCSPLLAADFPVGYVDATTDLSNSLCSNGEGLEKVGGVWTCAAWGAGGGTSIILDLGNNGSNESTGISKIATTGDTNNIATEPSADVLLFDMSKKWPTASAADALSSNPVDCGSNRFATAIAANGDFTCALLTDADIPDSITLTNLTQVGTRSHTDLTNIGTNTHAQIDTHIAATAAHGATGAVVGTTNTQTLSSKSFIDASTLIIDDIDATKKIAFQVSGLSTATTRTWTAADASGVVAFVPPFAGRIPFVDTTTFLLTSSANLSTTATGGLTAESLSTVDKTTAPGNRFFILDNDVNLTPDPTCANSGQAGVITLLDVDESASDNWVFCNGTSQMFDIPDLGSGAQVDNGVEVGTGPGTAAISTIPDCSGGVLAYTASTNTFSCVAAGSGDISSVWQTTSGAVTAAVLSTGDSIDASAADFFDLPKDKTITGDSGRCTFDTTKDQLVCYGTTNGPGGTAAPRVFDSLNPPIQATVISPATTDDPFIFKAPWNMTVRSINCIVGAATNVVIDVLECNTSGASCATLDAQITCTTTGAADDGTLSNPSITTGEWVKLDIVSTSGTPQQVAVMINYTIDQQ